MELSSAFYGGWYLFVAFPKPKSVKTEIKANYLQPTVLTQKPKGVVTNSISLSAVYYFITVWSLQQLNITKGSTTVAEPDSKHLPNIDPLLTSFSLVMWVKSSV